MSIFPLEYYDPAFDKMIAELEPSQEKASFAILPGELQERISSFFFGVGTLSDSADDLVALRATNRQNRAMITQRFRVSYLPCLSNPGRFNPVRDAIRLNMSVPDRQKKVLKLIKENSEVFFPWPDTKHLPSSFFKHHFYKPGDLCSTQMCCQLQKNERIQILDNAYYLHEGPSSDNWETKFTTLQKLVKQQKFIQTLLKIERF